MDPNTRRMLEGIQARMDRAGTVHEAEAATAAMQRLILKHNLNSADLEGLGKQEREEYISKWIQLGPRNTTGLQWRINLAYVMAEMNFCVFIREGVHGGTGWIVGQASNVEAVEIMYKATVEANERIAEPEWYSFRNSSKWIQYGRPGSVKWKNSFKIGFVAGVKMKMRAERTVVSEELEAGVVSALVVVKNEELKQAVKEKIGRTTTHKGSKPTSRSGFEHGVARGLEHQFRGQIDR